MIVDVEIIKAEPENLNAVLDLLAGASLPKEGGAEPFVGCETEEREL